MIMEQIANDQHVFIAGMTGSGKSVLAEIYLSGYENVIKLDTKGEYYERLDKGLVQWRGLVENRDYEVVFTLDDVKESEFKKIIYCPVEEELEEETYEAFFKWCYDSKNKIVWIDEMMEIAQSATRYPKSLKAIYTRGRSKKVAAWSCTQRPSDIPAIAIANSNHYFIYAMQLPQDRKKIADATGQADFMTQPDYLSHQFFYWRPGLENVVKARLQM